MGAAKVTKGLNMSSQMDLTATQMVWRPKLIRLTMIGNPDYRNGEPSACYIDPGVITAIFQVPAAFQKRNKPEERHPDVECTAVFYCHGTIHVLESPDEIARLREAAYGNEPTKFKAVP